MKRFRIEVPASSANLGPGFDCLGMALDIVDTITVEVDDQAVETCLEGGEVLGVGRVDNLLCRAYGSYGQSAGVELPEARFSLQSSIPIAKGFGSSAASIVAGLAAGCIASGRALDTPEERGRLLRLAAQLEGHADNTSAAVLGGVTVALCDNDQVRALNVANHLSLDVVLFVPEEALRTTDARAALPTEVAHADAVFNASRAAYLVTALLWGRWEEIRFGMQDRLHQQYRERMIPSLSAVMAAASDAGAYGAALSGGGPSIVALCSRDTAESVAVGMENRAATEGWRGQTIRTRVRHIGVRLLPEE
jgi:homoserine kinase